MNINVIGSDLNPRMVQYAINNIEWLRTKYKKLPESYIFEADATLTTWKNKFDYIVTETFLGKPFFNQPAPQIIENEMKLVNEIVMSFLQNIYKQSASGLRICIAIPAWYTNNGYKHLPILDHLDEIGYNLMSFKNVNAKDLVYHRPNQIVARQLLALVRK
jgi:tRNA G10  N-methylase Trm11